MTAFSYFSGYLLSGSSEPTKNRLLVIR